MLLQGRRYYVGRFVRITPAVGAESRSAAKRYTRECVFAGLRGNSTPSSYLRTLPNAPILTDIPRTLGTGSRRDAVGTSGLIPMDEHFIEAQVVDTQYFIA